MHNLNYNYTYNYNQELHNLTYTYNSRSNEPHQRSLDSSSLPASQQQSYIKKRKRSVWGDKHAFMNLSMINKKLIKFFTYEGMERKTSLVSLTNYFLRDLTFTTVTGIHGNNEIVVDLTEAMWKSRETIASDCGKAVKTIEKWEQAGEREGIFKIKQTRKGRRISFGEKFIKFMTNTFNSIDDQQETHYERMTKNRTKNTQDLPPKVGPLKSSDKMPGWGVRVPHNVVPKVPPNGVLEVSNEVTNLYILTPTALDKKITHPTNEHRETEQVPKTLRDNPLYDQLKTEKTAREEKKEKESLAVHKLEKSTQSHSVSPTDKQKRLGIFNQLRHYFIDKYNRFNFTEIYRLIDTAIESGLVDEVLDYMNRHHGPGKPVAAITAQEMRGDDKYIDHILHELKRVKAPPRQNELTEAEIWRRKLAEMTPQERDQALAEKEAQRLRNLERIREMKRNLHRRSMQ